jgi:hypothetical protein
MGWPDPSSRIAVALRRLRGRFGIAAPRVAVRTHIPWYWRALAGILIAAVAIALAGWIYDAGRRFAGFDRNEAAQEIVALRNRVAELEAQLGDMRRVATTSEGSLEIERTTQQQLSRQVHLLEGENVRLREDLAAFEQLSSGENQSGGLSIGRLRVEQTAMGGEYRYTMLVMYRAQQKSHEFNGLVSLLISVQQGGRDVIIQIPESAEPAADKHKVTVRHFRKIEGTFTVPPGSIVRKVEARLIQDGAVRASRQTNL